MKEEQTIQTCSICSVALSDNKSTLSFGVGIGGVGKAVICRACDAVVVKHMDKIRAELLHIILVYKQWDEIKWEE